jgi:glycosyltransferase involved in cell wall biosynthesis
MRILHLINHCRKANGHVNVSVDIACTQVRYGHTVAYSCADGDFISLLKDNGVNVFTVEEPHRTIKSFFLSQFQLWKAIREFRPEIIHVHMAAQSVLVQPYRLFGYNVITTVHNEFDRSVWLMGLATRVVTVSKAGYDAMLRRGFGKNRVRTVINGSIGSPRLPAKFSPVTIKKPAIITVCGLHPRKGVADLLKAFKHVKSNISEATLYVIGEGPMKNEYQELSRTLDLTDSVFFLGYRDDAREHLFAADIFVLASHADPGPLVIAEARNAGCAIVATDVDGIPEMLDFGAAGILVPPQQPEMIAAAIEGLLTDPMKLKQYQDLAKQNSERFTIDRVCDDLTKIYNELV